MNGSSAAIERILIVDDDAGAREGFGCSVEELGITPVPEPGPITDLDKFVARFPDEAQAVVCGYRLKTGGAYSSFNGDEVVAACFRRGIPGLLCTQYTDVVVEMNRRLLRFIPSLLMTSSPPPGTSPPRCAAARRSSPARFIPPGGRGARWSGCAPPRRKLATATSWCPPGTLTRRFGCIFVTFPATYGHP